MKDNIVDPFTTVVKIADLERIIKYNQDEFDYFTQQYRSGKMSRLVYAKFSKHYGSLISRLENEIKKLQND